MHHHAPPWLKLPRVHRRPGQNVLLPQEDLATTAQLLPPHPQRLRGSQQLTSTHHAQREAACRVPGELGQLICYILYFSILSTFYMMGLLPKAVCWAGCCLKECTGRDHLLKHAVDVSLVEWHSNEVSVPCTYVHIFKPPEYINVCSISIQHINTTQCNTTKLVNITIHTHFFIDIRRL